MSLTCDKDGKVGTEINKKGVLLTRRDNSQFVRKVYADVIMMVFNRAEMQDVFYHIIEELNKLCSHSYPKEDFAITKSIGNVGEMIPVESKNEKGKTVWKIGDYTVKLLPEDERKREAQFKLKNCSSPEEYYLHSLPAQAQLAEKMRDRGQLVAAGSRIEYVITTTGGHVAKQYVKVESAEYFSKHTRALEIDYLYYLKQLANPLDQVLNVIYDKEEGFEKDFTLKQYKYRSLTRIRVLNELKELFRPKLKFLE